MGLYLSLENIPIIIKVCLFFLGGVCGLLFIAIELFLFLLLNNKIRGIYIVYMMLNVILAVYLNSKFPFLGFIIFILFSFAKDGLRVLLVNSIYIPKEFNRYCKMFHIKVKDFKKQRKRVSKVPSKKNLVTTTSKKKENYTTKEATI